MLLKNKLQLFLGANKWKQLNKVSTDFNNANAMTKKQTLPWIFYGLMIIIFIILSAGLFHSASKLEVDSIVNNHLPIEELGSSFESFKQAFLDNIAEPSAILLLQILSILIVSRILSFIFMKIGQPTVIAEIIAGIVLGPSLLGYFSPDTFNFLFAADSLSNLYILSQLGLVLFMFTIGMELDLSALKNKMGVTFVISHASIVIPYFMGMLLAYFVYDEFAAGQTEFIPFALFIGISMSITAFPVLARIVQEKGLTKTHLGTISLASAAINDVTAWCILAAVIAIAKTGSIESSLYNIGFSILYVTAMFVVVKPFLHRFGKVYKSSELLNKSVFAFLILILIASSYITQAIGIHALFGAFLAGVIMPPIPMFRKLVVEKVEDISLTLLLPLFFVYTGLRTEIGLLNTPYLWTVCALFIVVAIIGKFVGSAFSAKVLGETWRDSLSIGILMNTRGLMELIVLNIGYEMGILPPSIFVMLVIMALVTTFMTTPILSLINRFFPEKSIQDNLRKQKSLGIFKVLIAMGNPENGKQLISIANTVLNGFKNRLSINILHITLGTNTNPLHSEQYSIESFEGINEEALRLNIPIETEYKVADDTEQVITRTANQHHYDFLLVGAGRAMSKANFSKALTKTRQFDWLNKIRTKISSGQTIFFPGNLIKDKTRFFIENSDCSVGVFVNRGFQGISTTVIILQNENDGFLFKYARRILRNNANASIFIMDMNNLLTSNESLSEALRELTGLFKNRIKAIPSTANNAKTISKFSLLVISYPSWNELLETDAKELSSIPSTLIINKKLSRFHST